MRLYHKDADFAAFKKVLAKGLERYPVELLTYCLMGNDVHLIATPSAEESHARAVGQACTRPT